MMTERVPVVERILGANERLAADNRARLDAAGAVSYTHLDVYKRQLRSGPLPSHLRATRSGASIRSPPQPIHESSSSP